MDLNRTVPPSKWVFVCVNIGDCKIFHYSQRSRLISDVTFISRSNSLDATDPGGRLGCYKGFFFFSLLLSSSPLSLLLLPPPFSFSSYLLSLPFPPFLLIFPLPVSPFSFPLSLFPSFPPPFLLLLCYSPSLFLFPLLLPPFSSVFPLLPCLLFPFPSPFLSLSRSRLSSPPPLSPFLLFSLPLRYFPLPLSATSFSFFHSHSIILCAYGNWHFPLPHSPPLSHFSFH